mmetsp:Transcript_17848/g.41622  ORF Transcript_17848/g.41622 Transcript_17848/m.41622 type:complete len:576 (-) Transcript_17848:86-1813(-)
MKFLVRYASLSLALSGSMRSADAGDAPLLRPIGLELTAPVLQEPPVQEHFGFLRNYTAVPLKQFQKDAAPQVLRVRNLDDATFQQYIRDGQPFVVEDCTRGFEAFNGVESIDQLECKDFADRWPTGNMRAEYTPGQYHIYLRDPNWYSKIEPTRQHDEHMAHKKKIAGPYIWHVKDEEPLKTKRSVQRHWRTPYFLQPSLSNRMEANESFEFWFSMAGGGTFTHADAYCESTISMQFRGNKRWRIQAFPEIRHFFNASSFGDEQIYGGKTFVPWTPETEFTVGPGECFIFPTGYLHETYVDPDENDQGCYTASTFQFNHPRQVNLYRAYLSRFSMSHYGLAEPCLDKMSSYATLLTKVDVTKVPSQEKSLALAAKILAKFDSDKDGHLEAGDFHEYFQKSKSQQSLIMQGDFRYTWYQLLNKAQAKEFMDEVVAVWSEDAIQYHDANRDGKVTVEEVAKSLLQWHVVRYRIAMVRTMRNSKTLSKESKAEKLIEFEVQMLKDFYCKPDEQCEVAEELLEFAALLKQNKKMGKKLMKLFHMFGDEANSQEGEVLTMVDRATGQRKAQTVGSLKSDL